jgi:hypothetical protein
MAGVVAFAGQRGQVVWKGKSPFLSEGNDLHYDTYLSSYTLIVHFKLENLIHIWDIGKTKSSEAKAIRLRDDRGYHRRLLVSRWLMLAGGLVAIGGIALWVRVHFLLGILAFLVAIALGVWEWAQHRGMGRHRRIRAILGPHGLGSSDPATWNNALRKQVADPRVAFQAASYADLAQGLIAQRRWSGAMWAARLCVLLEDRGKGERLTDLILSDEEVVDRLRYRGGSVKDRAKEFGPEIPAQQFLTGPIEDHILRVVFHFDGSVTLADRR